MGVLKCDYGSRGDTKLQVNLFAYSSLYNKSLWFLGVAVQKTASQCSKNNDWFRVLGLNGKPK